MTSTVSIGWLVLDHVVELADYPVQDTKTPAQEARLLAGGPTFRAAVALARQGNAPAMVATVGTDVAAAQLRAAVQDAGVADLLITVDGISRQAHVWLSRRAGSRTIVYVDSLPAADQLPATTVDRIVEADALLLDGREVAVAAQAARQTRGLVSLDVGSWKPDTLPVLAPLANVLTGPAATLARLAGTDAADLARTTAALVDLGADLAVTTSGDGRIVACDRSGNFTQQPYTVPVVDSNGAGDAFHGGLVAAIVAGADHRTAVTRAAAVAALHVAAAGDTGLPDPQQLDAFLRDAAE